MASPLRGDVWFVDLNPTRGEEQACRRAALVVSVDAFNRGKAGLVFVVPLSTRFRGLPTHVEVRPPAGGLREASWARCEDLRSISVERLVGDPLGRVPVEVLGAVGERLRLLLQL
jgi:mRNA interferase MazF